MSHNYFIKNSKIELKDYTKSKGKFEYLPWVYAVEKLFENDCNADYGFDDPIYYPDQSMEVRCWVDAFGKRRTMHMPVIDFSNKAVQNPDAMAINKAKMRCLTKCIAMFGIGLYVYAGEDLPDVQDASKADLKEDQLLELTELIEKKKPDLDKVFEFFNVKSLEALKQSQFIECRNMLRDMKARVNASS